MSNSKCPEFVFKNIFRKKSNVKGEVENQTREGATTSAAKLGSELDDPRDVVADEHEPRVRADADKQDWLRDSGVEQAKYKLRIFDFSLRILADICKRF